MWGRGPSQSWESWSPPAPHSPALWSPYGHGWVLTPVPPGNSRVLLPTAQGGETGHTNPWLTQLHKGVSTFSFSISVLTRPLKKSKGAQGIHGDSFRGVTHRVNTLPAPPLPAACRCPTSRAKSSCVLFGLISESLPLAQGEPSPKHRMAPRAQEALQAFTRYYSRSASRQVFKHYKQHRSCK